MAMKKNKLIINYDFDFWLAGITSSAKGYRLAWQISNALGIKFKRQSDLVVGSKDGEERNFAYYSQERQFNPLKLFKNRTIDSEAGTLLVPEYPHFDFILLGTGESDRQFQEEFLNRLRRIPTVEMVVPIHVEKLKSRGNFIL